MRMNELHNKHGPGPGFRLELPWCFRKGTVTLRQEECSRRPRDETVGRPRDGTLRIPCDKTVGRSRDGTARIARSKSAGRSRDGTAQMPRSKLIMPVNESLNGTYTWSRNALEIRRQMVEFAIYGERSYLQTGLNTGERRSMPGCHNEPGYHTLLILNYLPILE